MAKRKNVGRKRIDPKTILYEIDANQLRRVLGPPGDPKKHVPKLLAKLRDMRIDSFGDLLEKVKLQFPHDYARDGHELNLKNAELIGTLFLAATQIDPENGAADRSIVAAFEKAGLNVASPTDWILLMAMFCWAHFGEKGKPGRTIYWTEKKYCALLRDVHQIKRKLKCDEDAVALRHLREIEFRKYPFGFDRLKKALGEARDLNFNDALKKPTYDRLLKEPEIAHEEDEPWPDFTDPKSLLMWLSDKDAARRREQTAKVKATARSIADSIGAGIPFE